MKVITRSTFVIGPADTPEYMPPGSMIELDDAEARRAIELRHADPCPDLAIPGAAVPATAASAEALREQESAEPPRPGPRRRGR